MSFFTVLLQILDWESFDVFNVAVATGGCPLNPVCRHLLKVLGLTQRLRLQLSRLDAFLRAVEEHYLLQPYHNSTHAADVVQALGSMITSDAWTNALEDWELLALLIAAAVHDVGHPGVNNDFHMRIDSPEAKLYGSVGSINERHHAALAVKLLECPENDFFSDSLGPERSEAFKDLIRDLILHTDMKYHTKMVEAFNRVVNTLGSNLEAWPPYERREALQMLLHCADISNPARPLHQCTEWGKRVQEELYIQGDKERVLGLSVTKLCDRYMSAPADAQTGFIQRIMKPCMQALRPIAPKFVSLVEPHIAQSLKYWETCLHKEDDKGLSAEDETQLLFSYLAP